MLRNFLCFCHKYMATSALDKLCLIVLIVLCHLFSTSSSIAYAEDNNQNKVRIGYIKGYGIFKTSENEKMGYGYEYLKEIAKYTGWEYDFIMCSWEEGLELLRKGDLDLFGPIQKTSHRQAVFDFPERELGYEYGALYVHRRNNDIFYSDIDYFTGLTVGLIKDSIYNDKIRDYFSKHNIHVKYVYVDDTRLAESFEGRNYDMLASGSLVNVPNANVVLRFATEKFYLATTKGNTRILNDLNYALEQISLENVYFASKLYDKYYADKAINMPVFTRQETEFIKNNKNISVVVDPGGIPIEYFDEDEQTYKGIGLDLLTEIGNISGLKFHVVPTYNYSESKAFMRSGKAMLLLSYLDTADDLGIKESDPLLEVPVVLVGHKRSVSEQGDIAGIVNDYTKAAQTIQKAYPNLKFRSYDNTYEVIKALKEKQVDWAFINNYAFDDIVREEGINDYVMVNTDIKVPLILCAGTSTDPLLLQIINKSLKRISSNKVSSIIYLNTVNRNYIVPLDIIIKENAFLMIAVVTGVLLLIVGVIVVSNKRSKKELERIAYVDSLTGVATVNKFYIACKDVLQKAKANEYTLICFDIDNFKYINDSFGYEVGNSLLRLVAKHFLENRKKEELIARGSADNFVLLIKSPRYTAFVAEFVHMDYVQNHLGTLLPQHYHLVFSAGAYTVHDTTESITAMVDKANIARKKTKGNHISSIMTYTKEMNEDVEWTKEVTLYMESALHNNEFKLYLQPQVLFATEKIVGAEALVRWDYFNREIIPPARFISIFEQNGFIKKLDFYMFEQACRFLATIKDTHKDLFVSVNFSKMHLNNNKLAEELLYITQKYNVNPQNLEVELTETIALMDTEAFIAVAKQLKSVGFKVAIDDFGSGYSSLNLLKDLYADVLKIDKGFLSTTSDNQRGQHIIAKVIELARDLEMNTVVEGVETKEQAVLLKEMGCDIAQGYYYAEPMTVNNFGRLIKNTIDD